LHGQHREMLRVSEPRGFALTGVNSASPTVNVVSQKSWRFSGDSTTLSGLETEPSRARARDFEAVGFCNGFSRMAKERGLRGFSSLASRMIRLSSARRRCVCYTSVLHSLSAFGEKWLAAMAGPFLSCSRMGVSYLLYGYITDSSVSWTCS
jgi:hypothetical protein